MIFGLVQPAKTAAGHIRGFFTSLSVAEKEISTEQSAKPQTSGYGGLRKMSPKLSTFQKRILVFSRRFKSLAEVPDSVPTELLETARSRARIRLANYLMALTMLGCLGYAYSGRSAAKRGESVVQMNKDWHKEYNDKIRAEELKKKGGSV